MKVLAIEKELKEIDPVALAEVLQKEARVVWDMYTEGVLREHYFKEDAYEAVLVFECEDVESAQKLVERLPLVRLGYITFECIGLRPYPGVERLFSSHI